jgi:hypothetical protein
MYQRNLTVSSKQVKKIKNNKIIEREGGLEENALNNVKTDELKLLNPYPPNYGTHTGTTKFFQWYFITYPSL